MSIADRITQLTTIRASMREKLVAKGVDASTHNFADFPDDVESIPSGSSEHEIAKYAYNSIYTTFYYFHMRQKLSNGYGFRISEETNRGWYKLCNKDNSDFIYNLNSATKSARVIAKFKATSSADYSSYVGLFGDDKVGEPGTYSVSAYMFPNGVGIRAAKGDGSSLYLDMNANLTINEWYYVVFSADITNGTAFAAIYNDDGTRRIKTNTQNYTSAYNHTSGYTRIGSMSSNSMFLGEIDLTETFYEIDGECVWGQTNSKTQNMGLETE